MLHQFSRNELAMGKEGMEIMKNSTVAVLGVGELAHSLLRRLHALVWAV